MVAGDLESKDDFFLLNSEMVVIETSLTIFNKTLYKQLTPQSVPVWIRCQVANRMARNASEWVSLFSLYNSGQSSCCFARIHTSLPSP
jgi:hypothetical protein